jgi:protein O-GlcNAc transferase
MEQVSARRSPGGIGRGLRARGEHRRHDRDHPDDAEILVYLAEIYRNTDKPDLAIPLFERALRLDPSQLTATVGLGGIRMERGQFAEAIKLWEDALAKDSGLVLVRTNLALAYRQIGDTANSERHLKKVAELSPGFRGR